MRRAVRLKTYPIANLPNRSRGYILITLMLFVTLLALGMIAVLPEIKHQIQRDQEVEMIHRAVGYSRAVRKFYKKFNRYPTRIEELENTNNLRFLRKRYKDPLTGKDFRILHMSDIHLNNGPVLPGQSGFVGAIGGGLRQAGPGESNLPQVTGLPGTPNTGGPKAQGGDEDSGDSPGTQGGSSGSGSSGFSGPVFGGGPILGVASTSKNTTIRECNKKDHYNDWLFIYDPSTDRGGMLNTCWQQNTQGIGGVPQPGVQPQPTPNPSPGGPPPPPGPRPDPEPMPPEQ